MKPKILIFDDEKIVAEATALSLNTSRNLSALTAESGEQAIEMLRAKAIDVLLFSRDRLNLESCKFARAAKRDPQTQHVPMVIWSRTPLGEAKTIFQESGLELE